MQFTVANKGEIHVVVAAGQCVGAESIRTQTQTFTVTGGTGIYAGATGSGTLEPTLRTETPTGRHGRESWKGTLTVPGLDFDITPPTLIGAIAKHVRAPRTATHVRVTYAVTAKDEVDGTVPTTCRPKSGSRFRIGRTVVACTAVDKSANTGTARFTVTAVRRR
ncbi:MAG: HYR domain-containing protein [Actinobacteria bacterium]|nr:HYR domain-containing protein [Actinomycetota bacterium]